MALLGRRVVGNYTITALLGEGGMGAVYLAQHDTIDEKLAIKVLLPQYATRDDIVRRFVAEAKAASATKHPNIVRVFDVGRFDSGEHYMALEYLEGSSLDKIAPPLPLPDVLAIAVQVCAGLEAAHARGVIHRDLKPGNLFLAPQPENKLFTKILDFGIAKLVGDTVEGGVHTRTGVVMGTPAYMSPEQALGSAGVTPLSDVFSLGAILFKLVCGRKPFRAGTIGEIVHEQFTRPTPDPRALRPDLPARWRDIICASLSVGPELRPQGARELAELLIDATPGGADIALAVGYRRRPGPSPSLPGQDSGLSARTTAPRRSEPGGQSTLTAPSAAPARAPRETPAAATSSPAAAAGPESPAPARAPVSRSWRALIFAAVAAVGVGAGIVAAVRHGGRSAAATPRAAPSAIAGRDGGAGAGEAAASAADIPASARRENAAAAAGLAPTAGAGVAARPRADAGPRHDSGGPPDAAPAAATARTPPARHHDHHGPHRHRRRRRSWQVPKGSGGFSVPQ